MNHRFKVGQQIIFREEVYTITQLTFINSWPAYFVKEDSGKIADIDCSSANHLTIYQYEEA